MQNTNDIEKHLPEDESMTQFIFNWEEIRIRKVTVDFDDMVDVKVWHQPTNSMGDVVNREGKLFIIWPDAPDTDLQTKQGKAVLLECKPF